MSREITQFDVSNTEDLQGECGRRLMFKGDETFRKREVGELRARDLE